MLIRGQREWFQGKGVEAKVCAMHEGLQKVGEGEELFQPAPTEPELDGTVRRLLEPQTNQLFSTIYDNLLTSAGEKQLRSVLVCCASGGEGATTVATGLAVAAARNQVGQVLLIDGNCQLPRVCAAFGVAADGGLGDLVAGAMEADAVIKRTAIPDLSVMGVGVMPGDHIRALASPKFLSCVKQLMSRFQFILVDGPAVNPFPESALYAPSVDRVLLVVHAGVTRAPVAAKALARLSAAGCEKVDVILNRRTFAIPQAIYKRL